MMSRRLRHYAIFWGVTLLVLAADQLTKLWVEQTHHLHGTTHLMQLAEWFNVVYVRNTGAAWGALSGKSFLLACLAVVAVITLYFLRRALQMKRVFLQVAFGMLVAGILGNMIDRFMLGYVVDFIDMEIFGLRFLVFNIADVGITGGVALYLLHSVWEAVARRKKNISSAGV